MVSSVPARFVGWPDLFDRFCAVKEFECVGGECGLGVGPPKVRFFDFAEINWIEKKMSV